MKIFRVVFTVIFLFYLVANIHGCITIPCIGRVGIRILFLVSIIASFYKRNRWTWLFLLPFASWGLFNVLSYNELHASETLVTDMNGAMVDIIPYDPIWIRLAFLPVWHPLVYLVLAIVLLTKAGRRFWWEADNALPESQTIL